LKRAVLVGLLALAALGLGLAATGSADAKVTNQNTDDLPPGCDEVQGEEEVTVRAGREHAERFTGVVFTFDQRSWEVDPCTRLTVTFVNDDEIRHQFMVHGTYPYNPGFFQIQVTGPGQDTGTFITGSDTSSLLVHCGVRQHQQKGMKAQLLVGGGEGDIPNIPGVSGLPEGAAGELPHGHGGHEHDEHDASVLGRVAPVPTPGLAGALLAPLLAALGLAARRRPR
jgi:hypothetical protein